MPVIRIGLTSIMADDFDQSIPPAPLEVQDIQSEYSRLKRPGVVFTKEPANAGPVTIAVFSDTCGSLIERKKSARSPRKAEFRHVFRRHSYRTIPGGGFEWG